MDAQNTDRSLADFDYVSFDVVGTLIDFEGAITSALGAIAARSGVRFDAERALDIYRAARAEEGAGLFPDDLARCYGRIAAATGLPDTPSDRQALVDAAAEAVPFPDSVAALARLKRNARLIALTNARRWAFDKYAEKLGQPFWASLTTDDTGTEKPDPAFFERAFQLLRAEGADRQNLLHAAQSQYHDIGVARDLGLTSAWIQRRHGQDGYGGSIAPQAFTEPDHHFLSLRDLADAVEAAAA
ncbi:HAD-IA family hydrolase [Falsirhodobacter halotolerans]|uniref:HAD-IA family hydrolase n=1 Tax=Falsirhodobacter halotolerans TaxID=1146892 RepID=UPI001FD1D377|nr:HAD-IA family hydrolase [Falsirhodobacter halotolerans]MCJ8140980.1 HAD-IA family hydrolase [Falsirhodobacter halotolerans]